MDEMSPPAAVAVTLTISPSTCEGATNVEITSLKLVQETASLFSNSGLAFANEGVGIALIEEEEEGGEEMSSESGLVVVNEELSLPIAVEVEAIDDGGQIVVGKVIALRERSIEEKPMIDVVTVVASSSSSLHHHHHHLLEGSNGLNTSDVVLQLPRGTSIGKGGGGGGCIKSVYELDWIPLWGSMSICGKSSEMEDAVAAVPRFMRIPIRMFVGDDVINRLNLCLTHLTTHFFGVYDGHGGSQVANYCRDRVHLALGEEMMKEEEEGGVGSGEESESGGGGCVLQVKWQKAFSRCFEKVDDEVGGGKEEAASCCEPVAPETVGSTAVVALICPSHVVVANCGDSRAVLYRGKEAIALSVDHKPNREDEYARIEASGGKVIQWNGHRVFGVLAMSRSIGDRYLKPWIIPEPEVVFVPRAREDECLILASDGLWDVMSNEEACEVARRRILVWHKKNGGGGGSVAAASFNNNNNNKEQRGQGVDLAAQAAAEYLTMLAIQKGSKDNISVIVLDLKPHRKFKTKSSLPTTPTL
ncbi:probable protein phosphatase 2C 6 isoform X2 [Impatiens glandulifera]|nr:probable protein phosphatase 2C 6 isoform X2 [Impatiens glandulifera]XP_047317016.1 probable protein phosphatase 2C 6 isoform X2 [Impatiens glandulifera]